MGPTGGLFATGSGDLKARIWRVSRQIASPVATGPPSHLSHAHHPSGPPPQVHPGQREPPANWDRRKSLATHSQISGGQPSPLPPSPAQQHPPAHGHPLAQGHPQAPGPPQAQGHPQTHPHAQPQPHVPANPQNLAPVMTLQVAKPAIAPKWASPTGNGNGNLSSHRIPTMQSNTGPPPSPTRKSPVAVSRSPVQKPAQPSNAEMDKTD